MRLLPIPLRLAATLLALIVLLGAAPADRAPLAFEVTYAPEVRSGPISARVYVLLGPVQDSAPEPRKGPDWFSPHPFFAVEANDWSPDEPLRVGSDAAGFPVPLEKLKPGRYAAQAVIRLNPDTHLIGEGEGNAYGPVVRFRVDHGTSRTVALRVDRVVPPKPFHETETIKLVDTPSLILSEFYHRPIRHRAAVILPEGKPGARYPTLYIVPGFGGDHHMASRIADDPRFAYGRDMIRVVLSPDCGTGHHVFADSATNGPRGRALVEELIPHIEKSFRAIPEPSARFLNGHSSGGWSTLWLQVKYPDVFGGTWSTSPDPVDFRDFSAVNLYTIGENLFHDRRGERRPISRPGPRPVIYFDEFSRMEDVIGDGGQLHSFEAVFSPLALGGRPRHLWNRSTGAIDPTVAKAWEAYDIRLVLERNWPSLGPRLEGKIHVITGALDTFRLEGAVKLLKESLQKLHSNAVVEILPGKDHSNILDATLAARLDREMRETLLRARGPESQPRSSVEKE